jgi:mono/diheme cytochrome c family protein
MDSKRPLRLAVVVDVPLLRLVLAACSAPTPSPISTPLPMAGGDGHQLFITKGCAACHGQDGEGTALAPTVAGHSEAIVRR